MIEGGLCMNVKGIIRGTAIALVMMFLVLVIVSVINLFSPLEEKVTKTVILLGMCVCVAFSSMGLSTNCEKMKLVNSLCMGALVMTCIFILSIITNHGISGMKLTTSFVSYTASAAFGSFISK